MQKSRILVLIIAFIMASLSVAAGFYPTTEWTRPGSTTDNRHALQVDYGDMSANFGPTFAYTNTYAVGDYRPTLVADVDADETEEVLVYTSSSNYIRFLTATYTGILLENEFNLNGKINYTTVLIDYDSDGYPEIVSSVDYNLTVYSYNGTGIEIKCNEEIPGGVNVWPTPHLSYTIGQSYDIFTANSSGAIYNLRVRNTTGDSVCTIVDMESQITNSSIINENTNVFNSITNKFRIAPSANDLNRDGPEDIVVPCDFDADGNEGICVLKQGYKINGFFGPGYYDDLHGNIGEKIAGITTYNMDGSGDNEICVTSYGTGADKDSFLTCFNLDASVYINTRVYDTTVQTYISNPVMIDIDDDSYSDLCVAGVVNGADSYIACYSMVNKSTERILYQDIPGAVLFSTTTPISGADLDGDEDGDLVVGTYSVIIEAGAVSTVFSTAPSTAVSSIADVDNDGFLEILRQWSGNLRIDDSNATNLPPTINSSLAYGGYTGWYLSPTCINTTVTFIARDRQAYSESNYWNDIPSERERLVSDCGGLLSTSENGDYDSTLPTFSCYFNKTGIYPVKIYIEDGSNVGYRGSYNTQSIIVNVIDGISGSTCNNAYVSTIKDIPDISPAPSAATTQTQGIEDLFNIISLGSPRLKMLFGVFILVCVLFGMFIYGVQNGLAYAIVSIMMTMINVLFTLWPLYVLLIVIILMLLVLLIGKFILGGGQPSG